MNEQTYQDRPTLEQWNEVIAAAGNVPKIVVGEYTGDGAETRTISVGFMPKVVFLMRLNTDRTFYASSGSYQYFCGGLMTPALPLTDILGNTVASVSLGGFSVKYKDVEGGDGRTHCIAETNCNAQKYRYLAIG